MGRRTPPHPEYPRWSNARFWSFIRSALRQAWSRWPPKYEALNRASKPYKGTDKRRKKVYVCELCKGEFKQKEVEVDHITPAGSLRDYGDLPGFVKRLFVSADKLRVVCRACHSDKTKEERDGKRGMEINKRV